MPEFTKDFVVFLFLVFSGFDNRTRFAAEVNAFCFDNRPAAGKAAGDALVFDGSDPPRPDNSFRLGNFRAVSTSGRNCSMSLDYSLVFATQVEKQAASFEGNA